MPGLSSPLRSACLLTSFALGAACLPAQSTAALSSQGFYADPEVRIFNGEYWIYPTSSDPAGDAHTAADFNPDQQKLRAGPVIHPVYLRHTSFDAFSSPDLVHWTRHPDVLDVKNIPWAAYAMWAPSVIDRQGRFFFFFSANDIQKTDTFPGGIGIAVADSPAGPFKDLLGKPLVGAFHNGAQPIDPMAFQDDDGAVYLLFGGQGHCEIARLSSDLTHVVPLPDGNLYKDITPAGYVEGPFLIKRQGTYYFMWSTGSWENSTYGVSYATAPSPTGPFTPHGKILSTDPAIANGPGHHSMLHIPSAPGDTSTIAHGSSPADDLWYIVYHRHPLGTTGANQRVMAIDTLHFNPDGTIAPVHLTAEGPGPRPLPLAARSR